MWPLTAWASVLLACTNMKLQVFEIFDARKTEACMGKRKKSDGVVCEETGLTQVCMLTDIDLSQNALTATAGRQTPGKRDDEKEIGNNERHR
jgi:hypothetical protein